MTSKEILISKYTKEIEIFCRNFLPEISDSTILRIGLYQDFITWINYGLVLKWINRQIDGFVIQIEIQNEPTANSSDVCNSKEVMHIAA